MEHLGKKYDAEFRKSSTSPTPVFNTGFACHQTPPWLYLAPNAERKRRKSLVGRLKIVGSAASYPRSQSTFSLATAEASSTGDSSDGASSPTSSSQGQPESAAKALLSRGSRILRRHGSSFSLNRFILGDDNVNGTIEISETCQRPQRSQKKPKSLGSELISSLAPRRALADVEDKKVTISAPFDFHHVTHTQSCQFEKFVRGRHNDLITEFIAIRAAQRPKSTLQGIEAKDLRTGLDFKHPDAEPRRYSSTVRDLCWGVGEPRSPVSARKSSAFLGYSKSVRHSPSIENFSRPTPRSPQSPISLPCRTSSRDVFGWSKHPTGATIKSPDTMNGQHSGDFWDKVQSATGSILSTDDPNGAVAHAITTTDDSARPLKSSPLPKPLRTNNAGYAANAHPLAAHNAVSETLPLRHAISFPTARLLSQSNLDENAAKKRSGSLHAQPTGQWEDVIDYCYQHAAEADCNFDWSHKTIYIDEDLESMHLPAQATNFAEELLSLPDALADLGSVSYLASLSSARGLTRDEVCPQECTAHVTTEHEARDFPFGRRQPSSEFRGYKHKREVTPEPFLEGYAVLSDHLFDHDACLREEAYEGAGLGLPVEQLKTVEGCYSGRSSPFRGLGPVMSTYSSNGSLLSSITSAAQTCRSSSSVGSLPELVRSLNNSRENIASEGPSRPETRSSDVHSIRPRLPSGSRSLPEFERFTAEPRPSAAVVDATSDGPITAAKSVVRSHESEDTSVGKAETLQNNQARVVVAAARKRSASAATVGQRPPTRAAYNLFPPLSSSNRST